MEDEIPVWEALENVEFWDESISWRKFKKRLEVEGVDIEDIIEVFENYDLDKDLYISKQEFKNMVAHTTIHHNLEYPSEPTLSKGIEHGKTLGFLPKLTEVGLSDRIDRLDEKLENILKTLEDIDKKMNIIFTPKTNYGTTNISNKSKPDNKPSSPTKSSKPSPTKQSKSTKRSQAPKPSTAGKGYVFDHRDKPHDLGIGDDNGQTSEDDTYYDSCSDTYFD